MVYTWKLPHSNHMVSTWYPHGNHKEQVKIYGKKNWTGDIDRGPIRFWVEKKGRKEGVDFFFWSIKMGWHFFQNSIGGKYFFGKKDYFCHKKLGCHYLHGKEKEPSDFCSRNINYQQLPFWRICIQLVMNLSSFCFSCFIASPVTELQKYSRVPINRGGGRFRFSGFFGSNLEISIDIKWILLKFKVKFCVHCCCLT